MDEMIPVQCHYLHSTLSTLYTIYIFAHCGTFAGSQQRPWPGGGGPDCWPSLHTERSTRQQDPPQPVLDMGDAGERDNMTNKYTYDLTFNMKLIQITMLS